VIKNCIPKVFLLIKEHLFDDLDIDICYTEYESINLSLKISWWSHMIFEIYLHKTHFQNFIIFNISHNLPRENIFLQCRICIENNCTKQLQQN